MVVVRMCVYIYRYYGMLSLDLHNCQIQEMFITAYTMSTNHEIVIDELIDCKKKV